MYSISLNAHRNYVGNLCYLHFLSVWLETDHFIHPFKEPTFAFIVFFFSIQDFLSVTVFTLIFLFSFSSLLWV